MVRRGVLFCVLAMGLSLAAQTPSVRSYWAETVRRGLPLLALSEEKDVVPFWPRLDSEVLARQSVAPSADLSLLEGWALLQQDRVKEASGALEALWAQPGSGSIPLLLRGEAWFSTLARLGLYEKLMAAWNLWEPKYLDASVILIGLQSLEKTNPAAVPGVLRQALQLYPQDRRWLSWLVRYRDSFPQTLLLVQRDLKSAGFSSRELLELLRLDSDSRSFLTQAGYTQLDKVLVSDYATLVKTWKPGSPADGVYTWDQDGNGGSDHRVVFQNQSLQSWSKGTFDPAGESWSVSFDQGHPTRLAETHRDSRWTLDYESYPYVKSLNYRYGSTEIQYWFQPFVTQVPLGPAERLNGDPVLWPWQIDQEWKPLSLASLVLQAASVVTVQGNVVRKTLALASGQVWLSVEDSNADGRPDTWNFYRLGKLDRVYRNLSGVGSASLQELYSEGQFQSFLADAGTGKTTFALFPFDGVQLWDPQGTGTPLIRLLSWEGDQVQVQAFSGQNMPWSTMPIWEPQP